SWPSDLPAETNHSFVQSALEKAVESLHSAGEIKVEPVVDRDTIGVPGSPDIAATVLGKIDNAAVVVCDVSIVHRTAQGKCIPNPNVLIELGYAWRALTPERVILVFNEAFGSANELPFDLRTKKVQTYCLSVEAKERDEKIQ